MFNRTKLVALPAAWLALPSGWRRLELQAPSPALEAACAGACCAFARDAPDRREAR